MGERCWVWMMALGSTLSGCGGAPRATEPTSGVPEAAPDAFAPPAARHARVVRIGVDDDAGTATSGEAPDPGPSTLIYDHGSGHSTASFPDRSAAAASTAPTPAPSAVTSAVPAGQVTNAARVVAAMRPDFRLCYQTALAETPSLEGSIRVIIHVAANGFVSEATGTQNSLPPSVVDCVLRRAQQAKFDPPEGGSAIITVPVTFLRAEHMPGVP